MYEKKLIDARNNLTEMYLIQSLDNEFSFELPLFSKYPAISINCNFYKMTLCIVIIPIVIAHKDKLFNSIPWPKFSCLHALV